MIINRCEDEMICDLAETYHILNYKELSPDLVATLVLGLRDNSRVKMNISENKLTFEQMLLASAVDNLAFLSWTKTKDAQKNRNRPKSIMQSILDNEHKDELKTFSTIEEYEKYMSSIK